MEKSPKKKFDSTAAAVTRPKKESFLGGGDFFKPHAPEVVPSARPERIASNQQAASTEASSFASQNSQNSEVAIAVGAIPDILLSELDLARDVPVTVLKGKSMIDSVQWELIGPQGFQYLTTDDLGTSAPFYLSKIPKSFFTDPGKYYLRCYAFKDNGEKKSLLSVDEMDFNIIADELSVDEPVENDFGEFTVIKYHTIDNPDLWYQVEIEIRFQPKDFLSQWTLGFIQIARILDENGTAQWPHEDWSERATRSGWIIDRWFDEKTPWFKAVVIDGPYNKDGEYTYKTGYDKEGEGSFAKKGSGASLIDRPGIEKKAKSRSKVGKKIAQFESCVICKDGPYKGQIMGCITWGYEASAFSPKNPGTVKLMPLGIQANPSTEFFEASKNWNKHAKKRKRERIPDLKKAIE